MSKATCLVVGAGHAGVTLALQLRREGWRGPIKLIGADPELPYQRPPLSKQYLAGQRSLDTIRLRPASAYQNNDIELLCGATVTGIDRATRTLSIAGEGELAWDKLALCTGARVRKLPLDKDYPNLFHLRTASDAARLKPWLVPGNRAVIVGAGYIGLETASVLAEAGLRVTLIEMAERILPRVTGPLMSACVQALHERHGVTLRTSTGVASVQGESRIEAVVCDDGAVVEAGLVIAGIGVRPDTALAEEAGLAVEDGILVDEFTRTDDPDIVAAGDCTRYPSPLYKRRIRLESVQNATDQARAAAATVCGGRLTPYNAVPWFWSEQFGSRIQMAGLSAGHDQLVCRGEPQRAGEAGLALFYLKESRLMAADCIDRPAEFMAARRLLQQGGSVDADRLADESIAPADFLDPSSSRSSP